MADNKIYYYLKLKEGFFESDDMKLLQAMKDGYVYSDILLKLYLRSLRQEGRLMYRDTIPYSPEMIATITNHQVGTVEKAIKILEQMGFIEILDNGAIYMTDIQNFIGQSSTEADRIRDYRKRINAEKSRVSELEGVTKAITKDVHLYDERTPEIRDKSIEYRDIDKSINTLAQSSKKKSSEPEADVASIPLNDGSEWRPSQSLYEEYVRLYPNVNVKQQFNAMRGWCLSNVPKRKTRKGVTRFVNSWLSREQDKGYRPPNDSNDSSGYDPAIWDMLANERRDDDE